MGSMKFKFKLPDFDFTRTSYFVAVSTTFGLGNLWRFPYIASENGYGAFLWLYITLSLLVGAPLLINEILLGKTMGLKKFKHYQSFFLSHTHSNEQNFLGRVICFFPTAVSTLTLIYFSVLGGWVIFMFVQSFMFQVGQNKAYFDGVFFQLIERPYLQILLASVHLIFAFWASTPKLKKVISLLSCLLFPLFLGILFFLLYEIFNSQSSHWTFLQMLYPNFRSLKPESLQFALGHVIFTMSVGYGSMVFFGKRLTARDSAVATGSRVVIQDVIFSLSAYFVFVLMTQFALWPVQSFEILFTAISKYLEQESISHIWALFFFGFVYLTALNASVSIVDVIKRDLDYYGSAEKYKFKLILILLLGTLAIATLILPDLRRGFLDYFFIFDDVLINWLLPVAAIGFSWLCLRRFERGTLEAEFKTSDFPQGHRLLVYWSFLIRVFVPALFLFSISLRLFI